MPLLVKERRPGHARGRCHTLRGEVRPAAQGAITAISQGLVDIRTQVFPLAEAAEAQRRAEKARLAAGSC